MFINAFVRGGGETQFVRVARALQRGGYDVRIFTLDPRDDFGAEIADLRVHLLAPTPGVATVRAAVRELRRWRPDVVLNFLYQASILGRVAARLARTPVVISSMRDERYETRLRNLVFRLTGVLDSVTITNSRLAAATLRREGTVASAKLRVIPNGVDIELLDASTQPDSGLRAALGVDDDDTFLYVGVGRHAPQKDWATLVDAIARYRGPKAKWVIAGEGSLRDELSRQIAQAGVADRITLLGLRDDVPALLAAGDALVLSSIHEGLPNVVLEAMACARPVVATRVGGCEELLGTRFGRLVEPGDPQALALAMAELATSDRGERHAIGAAAREHVQAHYALESADRQWVGLLDDLLARTREEVAG